MKTVKTSEIVSLAKRRGFIYPSSAIYGGLANVWDLGPLGAELARNLKSLWWQKFVHQQENIYGLDSAILMNPQVWVASGHVASFNDPLVECRQCHKRSRVDHIIEDQTGIKVEGLELDQLDKLIVKHKVKCPFCQASDFTQVKKFNLLFKTFIGPVEDSKHQVYLRGETAQGIFVNFNNILNSFAPKLPFGIAQIGKAFRNEITPGNFIFRVIEFTQMEIEYFTHPDNWQTAYRHWEDQMSSWMDLLAIKPVNWRWRQHSKTELSHYSKLTKDVEYKFPFGFKELYGLAYRTDFDLKNHSRLSRVDLRYTDPHSGQKFFPHVIEPSFGFERTLLMLLLEHYHFDQNNNRHLLTLPSYLSPYQAAVFPLVRNKVKIVNQARQIYLKLINSGIRTDWDDHGNIGKRYRRQDEIGTPYTITIDHQTLSDKSVTVRDRDSMKQDRVSISQLLNYLKGKTNV